MRSEILVGDCLQVMRTFEANSFDSIVTDPPYHLTTGKKGGTGPASVNLESPYGRARIGTGFMGKAWDGGDVAHRIETWAEALRVAKPGAWLAAFGGTRTYHRLACAIEDAGWELRDSIAWIYGSGFPKSHNGPWGGTALKPGNEPIVLAQKPHENSADSLHIDSPVAGAPHELERIILARKPLIGTVEANWRKWGTGGLNIDGCRIGWPDDQPPEIGTPGWGGPQKKSTAVPGQEGETVERAPPSPLGRWPANLIHDGSDEVVALFPREAGACAPVRGTEPSASTRNAYGEFERAVGAFHGDTGSAARFFKQAEFSDEDWIWQHLSLVPTAGSSFNLQNDHVASAVSHAATAALPVGSRCGVLTAPSTSVTATELRQIATVLIGTIQNTGSAFWLGQPPGVRTPSGSHARAAVAHGPTGTTTITVSHWKSDGSAEPVTFSIIATTAEAGGKDSERFRYCAKADRADRNDGCDGMPEKPLLWSSGAQSPGTFQADGTRRASENHHPTVKPTDLMRWLCRLVTPAGGVVLDPFAGSGSTGRGAIAEGMRFVGIELDPDYARIAEARIRAVQPGLAL